MVAVGRLRQGIIGGASYDAAARETHRSAILGQPEEEEIGAARANVRVEELGPSRTACSRGSEQLLGENWSSVQGAPGKAEGVLPRGNIASATGAAEPDHASTWIIEVGVAEGGLVESNRCARLGRDSETGSGDFRHGGCVHLDQHTRSAVVGADGEGCAIGNIDDRRRKNAGVRASAASDDQRPDRAGRRVDGIEGAVLAPDHEQTEVLVEHGRREAESQC